VKKDGKKRIYQRVKKIALKNLKGSSIEESRKKLTIERNMDTGRWTV